MTLECGKRWIAEKRPGNVLSIVTTYAWTGSGYVVPSAMGKARVLAMTRSLAVEWGPKNIRLNAIAPGAFPTEGAWSRLLPRQDLAEAFEPRNPLGRTGDHDELTKLGGLFVERPIGLHHRRGGDHRRRQVAGRRRPVQFRLDAVRRGLAKPASEKERRVRGVTGPGPLLLALRLRRTGRPLRLRSAPPRRSPGR